MLEAHKFLPASLPFSACPCPISFHPHPMVPGLWLCSQSRRELLVTGTCVSTTVMPASIRRPDKNQGRNKKHGERGDRLVRGSRLLECRTELEKHKHLRTRMRTEGL